MMDIHISNTIIAAIIIVMLLGIIIPVTLFLVLNRKYKCKPVPFFVGCGTFFVFACILEQLMHLVVLQLSPAGSTIQGNIWLYGVYGALAAAVFEEVGRYVAMRFVLLKNYPEKQTGVMYGAGHGGFECLYLLVIGMVNNLSVALMVNSGKLDAVTATLTGEQYDQLMVGVNSLASVNPALFVVSVLERIFAITGHVVMSVLVWKAVTSGKKRYFAYALGMHFMLDFLAVIINNYFGMVATEICVGLYVAICLFLVLRRNQKDTEVNHEN